MFRLQLDMIGLHAFIRAWRDWIGTCCCNVLQYITLIKLQRKHSATEQFYKNHINNILEQLYGQH